MRGRSIEALLKEFFHRHPLGFAINAMTPGADVQKFFKLLESFQTSTSRSAHQQPDSENEEHLEDRAFKVRRRKPVFQNQGRQAEQRIEPAQSDDGEKAEALIREHFA